MVGSFEEQLRNLTERVEVLEAVEEQMDTLRAESEHVKQDLQLLFNLLASMPEPSPETIDL